MEKRATSVDENTEFQVTQTYMTPMTFGEAAKFTPFKMKDTSHRMEDESLILINNQQQPQAGWMNRSHMESAQENNLNNSCKLSKRSDRISRLKNNSNFEANSAQKVVEQVLSQDILKATTELESNAFSRRSSAQK